MPNFFQFLQNTDLEELGLPVSLKEKLASQGIEKLSKLYSIIKTYQITGLSILRGVDANEFALIQMKLTDCISSVGLSKPGKLDPRVLPVSRTNPSKPLSLENNPQKRTGPNASTLPKTRQKIGEKSHVNRPEVESKKAEAVRNDVSLVKTPVGPLDKWEEKFRSQLYRVELIGEIPVSSDELTEIGIVFKSLFRNRRINDVLEYIEKACPVTFAIFLVGLGIYGYKGGDYWTNVSEVIGQNTTIAIGQSFHRILKKYRLPLFLELQEKATKYVSLILAHGGIPVYCLKDYFANIILPTVMRSDYEGLSVEELVDEVTHRSQVQFNTDKPVIHFLEFGGQWAQDFVQRSRTMALDWLKNRQISTSEQTGLPEYVLNFFHEWAPQNCIEQGRVSFRMKRPEVRMDPWGYGFYFFLPSQRLNVSGCRDASWTIHYDNLVQEQIPTTSRRKGYELETEEITLELDRDFETCVIEFLYNEQTYSWTIKGTSSENHILCFEVDRGTLQNHILSKSVWLYFSRKMNIEVQNGDLLEKLPRLPGQWRSYQGEYWDLSHAEKIIITQDQQPLCEIPIQQVDFSSRPSLSGGNLFPAKGQEDCPVYIGKPPKIIIPSKTQNLAEWKEELLRWRISIQAIGDADPSQKATTFLNNLKDAVVFEPDCGIVVNLASKLLLGNRPIGTYTIDLRGPLGRDAAFTFSILPELHINGGQDLYIPEAISGGKPALIKISCGLHAHIENINPQSDVQISYVTPGNYRLSVPGNTCEVPLVIIDDRNQETPIRILIQLVLRRIQWRLVTDRVITNEWQDHLITMSIPAFLQSAHPLLIVNLPLENPEGSSVELKLVDISGQEIISLQCLLQKSHSSKNLLRFDLEGIADILRDSTGVVRLELVYSHPTRVSDSFRLPVVSLTKQLDILELRAFAQDEGDSYQVSLIWHEETQLQYRVLYLWSKWRLWQKIIIQKIPDSSLGEFYFSLPKATLVPGEYILGMAIVDPWIGERDIPLPTNSFEPGASLQLISPYQRYSDLLNMQRNSRGFENHLETSILCKTLGLSSEIIAELDWCVKHINLAKTNEILFLINLIDETNQQELRKEIHQNLVDPRRVKRLINEIRLGGLSIEDFHRLIPYDSPNPEWSEETCKLLIHLHDPDLSFHALRRLVEVNLSLAIEQILSMYHERLISKDNAVDLLFDQKYLAIEILNGLRDTKKEAAELLELLHIYSPYWGLPTVKPGTWIECNAGSGRIQRIEDPITRLSVEEFIEGKGCYILHVALNIELTPDLEGEAAVVDMKNETITFPRAAQIHWCKYCSHFASARRQIYQSHLIMHHPGDDPQPPQNTKRIHLDQLTFFHNPSSKESQS